MRYAALAAGWLVSFVPPALEAGAWTLPAGENRLKAGFLHQDTRERYFLDGERIPYFFDGRNRTTAIFFEYARGLTARWDVRAQIPFYSISFDDIADDRTTNGPGDLRVESRCNLIAHPLVLTVGGTLKLPTGEFVNDAEVVPVGEGQYDFDVFAEAGRSLWPLRGYVTGRIGYRWREANSQTNIDFGNEILWHAEIGYELMSSLRAKLQVRGLHGFESTSFDVPIETLKREAVYVEPGVSYAITETDIVEVSLPLSVRGRNWPAGPVLSVGFIRTF